MMLHSPQPRPALPCWLLHDQSLQPFCRHRLCVPTHPLEYILLDPIFSEEYFQNAQRGAEGLVSGSPPLLSSAPGFQVLAHYISPTVTDN